MAFSEAIDVLATGYRLRGTRANLPERLTYAQGEAVRQAAKEQELRVLGLLACDHGPVADAALLIEAGYLPVGSIGSLDYPAAVPGIAEL